MRDGAQTEGVIFIEDKNKIQSFSRYWGWLCRGGWPGANPVDTKFFSNPPKMQILHLQLLVWQKKQEEPDNDPGLASLINANTPSVCVVGKNGTFM